MCSWKWFCHNTMLWCCIVTGGISAQQMLRCSLSIYMQEGTLWGDFSKQPACEDEVIQSWWHEVQLGFLWLDIFFMFILLLKWNVSSVFSIIMQKPFVVNDSQAFILFTYKNLRGFLMFKLLLVRQTLLDFDVLLPWNHFTENLVRHSICARWSPGETDITSGKD